MYRTLVALFVALTLTLPLVACSKKKKEAGPCDQLSAKICEGLSKSECKQYQAAFDKQMTGPKNEALDQDAKDLGCKMFLSDDKSIALLKAGLKRRMERDAKAEAK
jgi:hypothetical protein